MKNTHFVWQLGFCAVPLLLSLIASLKKSPLLLILCVAVLFADTLFLPLCKKRENLWMFLLAGLSGIPVNIRLIAHLYELGIYSNSPDWLKPLEAVLTFAIFASAEEIVFGLVTRILRRKQYPMVLIKSAKPKVTKSDSAQEVYAYSLQNPSADIDKTHPSV